MALIQVYGEQVATAQQPAAPVQVTDLRKLGAVLRAFPLGEYFHRTSGWLPPVSRGIARTLSRFCRRKEAFERNVDPRTADELLDEWESALGLKPDPGESIDDRRDAVLTKLRSLGGVTAAYYEGLADSFGYADAVVTDAADPFTTESLCDDFLQDLEWKVTMQVTAASQGATRDQLLQDLINSQLLAGFFAIYTFT
jgi:uncharacterized protein YmfQ (DUF2313 family)